MLTHLMQSPLADTLLSLGLTGVVGLITLIVKLSVRLSRMEGKLEEIGKDLSDIKEDKDVVRWSEIRSKRSLRSRRVW